MHIHPEFPRDYGYIEVQEYFDPYEKVVIIPTNMKQDRLPLGKWTTTYVGHSN